MEYTIIKFPGDGVTDIFNVVFPLGFISESDVSAYVEGEVDGVGERVPRPITFLSPTLIQLGGDIAATSGKVISFERSVDKENLLVDYEDGDIFNEPNLNTSQKQMLMAVQEVIDGRTGKAVQNQDMGGNRVINVGDPQGARDATNKQYVDAKIILSKGYADSAAASATSSAESAQLASEYSNSSRMYSEEAGQHVKEVTPTVVRFSGDSSNKSFDLGIANLDEKLTNVFVSGVYQQKDTYDVTGGVLTFSEAPPTGVDNIEVNIGGTTAQAFAIPSDESVTLTKLAPGVLDFGNMEGELPSSVMADQEEAEEGSDNLKAMTPLRTLQTVREGGFIPKNLFGLRDSLANQSGALQAAVNGIAEETVLRGTGRGAVLNIEGWTGRIDDDITLPRHVRVGGLRPVPAVYYGEMIDEWQPAIELASTATIRQETGSGLHNMMIRRQGLITYGGDGITEVGKFAGTAISIPNNTGDQRNQGLTILGFNRAVDTLDPVGGDTALISRPFFQDIYIDCINGIRIKNAYDIPKLFSIHGNPWVTEQLSGLAADKHFRNGTFISLEGVNDWAHLWDCFSYAWLRGFDINGADDVRMFACGADHLPERVDDGSIGLLVQGTVFDLIVQGYVSAAKQTSMYLNSFDPDARYMVSGFATHAFDQNAIVLERGKLVLSQSNLRGPGGGSGIGIHVASTAERLTVGDTVTFEELGVGILGHASVPQLVSPRSNFKNVATRHSGRYVPSVASASVMTIPSDFNFISVTGSVGVGTMLSENVEEGRIIEIQAVHGVTVFDTVAATANTFRLGSDIMLSAGDLLRVTRDINGQWRKAT